MSRRHERAAASLLTAFTVTCAGAQPSPAPTSPAPPATPIIVPPTVATPSATPQKNEPTDAAVAPAPRPAPFTELAVPGFESAVVSFPETAPLPEPVLIATHGAGDTPVQMCKLWRAILGDRGVVLCPAGPRMRANEEGRYYPDHHALERITFASLQALHDAYPGAADTANAIYTGYSQGATMGALMLPEHGAACPRLVLAEGGFDDWTLERATTFEKGGGVRALFICGRQRCKSAAERSAAFLKSAGVDAHVVSHVGEGHVVRIADLARPELDWLLAGDARWRTVER